MAVAKTGNRSEIKKRKKQRSCMRYRFVDFDEKVTFLDVGAFSSGQSWKLANMGLRALGINGIQTHKSSRWGLKKKEIPKNAPEKGCFVIHDGNLLEIE